MTKRLEKNRPFGKIAVHITAFHIKFLMINTVLPKFFLKTTIMQEPLKNLCTNYVRKRLEWFFGSVSSGKVWRMKFWSEKKNQRNIQGRFFNLEKFLVHPVLFELPCIFYTDFCCLLFRTLNIFYLFAFFQYPTKTVKNADFGLWAAVKKLPRIQTANLRFLHKGNSI